LRLLEARCSFAAPRVLYESADGEFDVRSMVPGMSDAFSVYAEVRHRPELAATMGRAIGMMLAEQHTRMGASDVAQWLPSRPAWPERREWVRERLPTVVDDRELITRAEAVMEAYESVVVADADRALVHTDVGFHNLGIDPRTFAVQGIFDYEGAAWADRHHDFRYLVLDFDRYDTLDAASEAYESATVVRSSAAVSCSTTQRVPSRFSRSAPASRRTCAGAAERWRRTSGGRNTRSRTRLPRCRHTHHCTRRVNRWTVDCLDLADLARKPSPVRRSHERRQSHPIE
jgi:hypothetical protein